MKKTILLLLLAGFSAISYAGDLENILACVDSAKNYSGLDLDVREVSYEPHLIANSTATWSNVYCEVKFEEVSELVIGDVEAIIDGYAGRGSLELYETLSERTEVAIDELRARIGLLRQELRKASADLSSPNPVHSEIEAYIDSTISSTLNAGVSTEIVNEESEEVDRSEEIEAIKQRGEISSTEQRTAETAASAPGDYYVTAMALNVRLSPHPDGKVTNKIYRQQKVEVFEIKFGWARISESYDGRIEDVSGQVSRWISAKYLSAIRPEDLAQPVLKKDSRINGIPKVGSSGATVKDVKILYSAAHYYLKSGKCNTIEYGDKSISKSGIYYLNCGGRNFFFKPSDIPGLK